MRVFVTGATGFIGKALTSDLLAHGHQVVGLARSEASATALRATGAKALRGSVRDLESLRRGAAEADGVIHLAFTFSPLDMPIGRVAAALLGGAPTGVMGRMMRAIGVTDRDAINALGAELQGSGRPLVTTFAAMGVAGAPGATFAAMGVAGAPGDRAERPATEEDAPNPFSPGYTRAANEQAVMRWAARGVLASVVRLAPSVHGEGDKGLVPQLAAAARKHGEAIYIGDGANRWCGVHRDDAATLFRRALESGVAGRVYHGIGDDGLQLREIAEIIGRRLGLPVASKTIREAQGQLGWITPFVAVDNPVTSQRTQQDLGWRPGMLTFAQDLDREEYLGD
ncbi:MAG: SDR family oxidoreductase [Caulobacteraceae bacterium]